MSTSEAICVLKSAALFILHNTEHMTDVMLTICLFHTSHCKISYHIYGTSS